MKNLVAALMFALALPCVGWTGDDQQVKPLKIGVATFSHETGLAGAIFEIDTPGLGPADLTTLEYENVPKDLYPISKTE